jgi:hypothetical protein
MFISDPMVSDAFGCPHREVSGQVQETPVATDSRYTLFIVLSVRQARLSALAVLLIGVLLLQIGEFDPTHGDNHARHCCPACHAGHIFATAKLAVVPIAPPTEAHRHAAEEAFQKPADPAVIAGLSRAPPA